MKATPQRSELMDRAAECGETGGMQPARGPGSNGE